MFLFLKKKREEEPKKEEHTPTYQQPAWLDQLKQITDSISSFSKAIRNLEARTQDVMEKLDAIEEKVTQHDEEIKNVKDSVEKMFVLYDWLMKQYNPFIEEEDIKNKEEKTESSEQKINEQLNLETKEYGKYLPLDEIKDDPAFIAIIMGWLNYLVSKSNIEEAQKALEYYEEIGWITEDVKIKLEKYLEGFRSVEQQDMPLTPEDHLVSLYIITKLKAGIEEGIIRFRDLYEELINKGIIKPIRNK